MMLASMTRYSVMEVKRIVQQDAGLEASGGLWGRVKKGRVVLFVDGLRLMVAVEN